MARIAQVIFKNTCHAPRGVAGGLGCSRSPQSGRETKRQQKLALATYNVQRQAKRVPVPTAPPVPPEPREPRRCCRPKPAHGAATGARRRERWRGERRRPRRRRRRGAAHIGHLAQEHEQERPGRVGGAAGFEARRILAFLLGGTPNASAASLKYLAHGSRRCAGSPRRGAPWQGRRPPWPLRQGGRCQAPRGSPPAASPAHPEYLSVGSVHAFFC